MKKIITISREYAAGGRKIAKLVAEQLNIPYYDKDIVKETAKASGFEPELIESEGEVVSRTDSILKTICSASSLQFNDTQEVIHDVQQAIILRLVREGPCVIVGRCADEIMRQAGIDSLNVFIHADQLHRAVYASELTGITSATELQKLLKRMDTGRQNYYTHYTGRKWGDLHNYHLSLDSGTLGYDLCAKFIVEAFQAEN
jgi:cytidylate kinase